jgi:hypothetical protein
VNMPVAPAAPIQTNAVGVTDSGYRKVCLRLCHCVALGSSNEEAYILLSFIPSALPLQWTNALTRSPNMAIP